MFCKKCGRAIKMRWSAPRERKKLGYCCCCYDQYEEKKDRDWDNFLANFDPPDKLKNLPGSPLERVKNYLAEIESLGYRLDERAISRCLQRGEQ